MLWQQFSSFSLFLFQVRSHQVHSVSGFRIFERQTKQTMDHRWHGGFLGILQILLAAAEEAVHMEQAYNRISGNCN
jgi:hypothetical protein